MGSEMCIRDRSWKLATLAQNSAPRTAVHKTGSSSKPLQRGFVLTVDDTVVVRLLVNVVVAVDVSVVDVRWHASGNPTPAQNAGHCSWNAVCTQSATLTLLQICGSIAPLHTRVVTVVVIVDDSLKLTVDETEAVSYTHLTLPTIYSV